MAFGFWYIPLPANKLFIKTKFIMKTIILVVENIQSQLEKAKEVIEKDYPNMIIVMSTNFVDASQFITEMKGNIRGIVTNLNFPVKNHYEEDNTKEENKFTGLGIVSLSILNNIPVVAHGKVDEYFEKYLQDILKVFASHKNYHYPEIPFYKGALDWTKALQKLVYLRER